MKVQGSLCRTARQTFGQDAFYLCSMSDRRAFALHLLMLRDATSVGEIGVRVGVKVR
jgi:hypothetical protein